MSIPNFEEQKVYSGILSQIMLLETHLNSLKNHVYGLIKINPRQNIAYVSMSNPTIIEEKKTHILPKYNEVFEYKLNDVVICVNKDHSNVYIVNQVFNNERDSKQLTANGTILFLKDLIKQGFKLNIRELTISDI